MRRSSLLCLLFLLLFSLGYRTGVDGDDISRIYLVGSTLIRTTPGTGIRLYDLSNPSAPRQRGSVAVPGANDVAVMEHYMYADDGLNLVIYDIADIANPRALDTIGSAFTFYPRRYYERAVDETSGGMSGCGACSMSEPTAAPTTADAGGAGQAGSMARFAIAGHYLYCIDNYTLRAFDISDPARPRYKNSVNIGWQIETLFPHDGNLYIGGREGMYIYSLSDEDNPAPVGEFRHPRRCDPVVVEEKYAYVTLRSGGTCGGNDNQMDILDITNLSSPRLVSVVPLTGPYGLAVSGGLVAVCDGTAGVRVFDARNPTQVVQVGGIEGINAHDIILNDRLMIVTAESGFYLYDASDLRAPKPYGTLQF